MKSVCIPFAALAASLTLLGGCASAPIVVSDSQLNWLQITCRPSAPGAPHCRINLIGVGYIEFIEGHSPRVANDFSLETDHARWQDAYQEKLSVPPDVIRDWLQLFADAGVMDSSKNRISHKEGGAVKLRKKEKWKHTLYSKPAASRCL